MLPVIASVLLVGSASSEVTVDYASFRGMRIVVEDTALVEGSSFQFYEPNFTKGHYSSAWKPVQVVPRANGAKMVLVNGDNGRVAGSILLTPIDGGTKADYEFTWRGEKPVMFEASVARLWAPLLADGSLYLDSTEAPFLNQRFTEGTPADQRWLGQSARQIKFDAPSVTVNVTSDRLLKVMDARNYGVEWARDRELFWLGVTNVQARPNEAIRFSCTIQVEPKPRQNAGSNTLTLAPTKLAAAISPVETPLPLLPKPRQAELSQTSFLDCTGGFSTTLPGSGHSWLGRFLDHRFRWDKLGEPVPIRVEGGETPGEAYQLTIGGTGVTIRATGAGVARAYATLGMLVRPRQGRLVVPYGTVKDQPSVNWRGAHLFVGPKALGFQSKLMDTVLVPLKFNKVVLQCERTAWDAVSGTETPMTMPKQDLVALFDRYRQNGMEPIPLIQSLGHMEWLFANGQNLDLAVNPEVPYTIDPRKSAARAKLEAVWQEAATALKPQVAHFGLDEIDMRGMPDDPHLTSRLWDQGVPFLTGLAKRLGMKPMAWGDMMLHPTEAPDAANAESLSIASSRRKSFGSGGIVADWHYKDDPDPETFKSLKLWKTAGQFPVGASWYRAKNIRGQALAAASIGGGLLQTTWAGYESNEPNLVKNFEQFAAFVTAADYAWSGRTEMPADLGYDRISVLQRLYFAGPEPLKPVPGVGYASGSPRNMRLGSASIPIGEPVQLYGLTTAPAYRSARSVRFPVNVSGNDLYLAMDCLARLDDSAVVARVSVKYANGTTQTQDIAYGTDVRAIADKKSTVASARSGSISAVRMRLRSEAVVQVTVETVHAGAGCRVYGMVVA